MSTVSEFGYFAFGSSLVGYVEGWELQRRVHARRVADEVPDSCLLLYPQVAWEPIGSRLQSLSNFNEQARWWQRLLVGFAEELELDSAGRILVSPALRKFAKLEKQVMLGGQGSHFELWDNATWEEKLAGALTTASNNPPPGAENFTL